MEEAEGEAPVDVLIRCVYYRGEDGNGVVEEDLNCEELCTWIPTF